MRMRKAATILLLATISLGLVFSSKAAFAHTFGSDESASFIAKVNEINAEASIIQSDAGNSTLLTWHINKIGQYWTTNDTIQMAERNQLLSKEIPSTISDLANESMKSNPNSTTIKAIVDKLNGYMSESVTARIDPPKLQNLTVSALAIKAVLDEVTNDYGNATGSSSSSMNMSSSSSMSGSMSMSSSNSSSSSSPGITNYAAYQGAQGLFAAAQNMWNDLKAKTPSSVPSVTISDLDSGFSKLKQIIDNRQTMDQFLVVLHGTIHPDLMKAFSLQPAAAGGMNNMGSGSMNMTGTGQAMSLDQKRVEYLKENSMQRHNEHLSKHFPNAGGYDFSKGYTLKANGTDQLSLNLSIFRSTGSIVSMDILGGSVKSSSVQAGYAYYLANQHKFIVFGYVPQKDSSGGVSSVQLLRLWATSSGQLPKSSSDAPLSLNVSSSASGLGGTPINVQAATVSLASSGNSTSTGTAVTIVPGAQNLGDKAFSPNPIQVKKGDTVTWTNTDTAVHTVTSGDGTTGTPDGTFDSKILSPHKTFSYTFANAGTFKYYCQLHPTMLGEVDVS